MGAKSTEAETADMRATIASQILNWADGADWADDQNAERVFEKLAEAPERFVSPNPGANVSWIEEASRIYHDIKEEHGLRTVSEAKREATDYNDRAKRHAAKALREQGQDVAADIADEFGEAFVAEVLGPAAVEEIPTVEEEAAAFVEKLEAENETETVDETTPELETTETAAPAPAPAPVRVRSETAPLNAAGAAVAPLTRPPRLGKIAVSSTDRPPPSAPPPHPLTLGA